MVSQVFSEAERYRGVEIVSIAFRCLFAMASGLFMAVSFSGLFFVPLIMLSYGAFELVSVWQLAFASAFPLLLLHQRPRRFVAEQMLVGLGDMPRHVDGEAAPPICCPTVLRMPLCANGKSKLEWESATRAWGGMQIGVFFLGKPFFRTTP